MFGKSKMQIVAVLAMAATLMTFMGGTTALAQGQTGTGPGNAMSPGTGWVTIQPGEQQWYTFFSNQASADKTDAAITIQLTSVPQNSVSFAVWPQAQLTAFNSGDTNFGRPVGNGTLHPFSSDSNRDYFNGDLAWVGRSLGPTTYYVQVASKASTPVAYMLKIAGNYISFPSGTPSVQAVKMGAATTNSAQTAPAVLPATGQSAAPSAGVSPAASLSLNGQTRVLNPGQQEWYSFQYPGHNSNGDQPTAQVVLLANPPGSATFAVWTKQKLQALAGGNKDFGVPLGFGSLHPYKNGDSTLDRFNGDLQWAGQSPQADTYYVQVMPTGSTPSTYSLQFKLQ